MEIFKIKYSTTRQVFQTNDIELNRKKITELLIHYSYVRQLSQFFKFGKLGKCMLPHIFTMTISALVVAFDKSFTFSLIHGEDE